MMQLLKLEKYVPPAIHDITLLNDYSSQDADHKNSKLISDAASAFGSGQTFNVTLQDRTLYKDGDWNTLCLPFSMTEAQIAESTNPLNGATIKELVTEGDNATNLTNGTLTLMLQTVTSIEAGKPYIVKWNPGEAGIENPVFSDVTITSTGCNITAKGGKWAAGIGSGRDASGGDIVITGGTINATGGDYGPVIDTNIITSITTIESANEAPEYKISPRGY